MQINWSEMEKKWQKKWKDEWIYSTHEDPNKEKFYILDMFPYPSGAGLHVWHPKWYVASDTLARKKMLEWYSVLHPMGFDTFWLGTELYAIEKKMKPQVVSQQNIDYYKQQLEKIWFSYDWDRSFSTAEPEYFRWTQWIFLQFFTHYYDEELDKAMPIENLEKKLREKWLDGEELKKEIDNQRLAYVDFKPINWCPSCKTWLANEDLADGKCERCGSAVEQKPMRQRVLRITKYAERLIKDLDGLDWDESMKELERNWIGRSEWTQFKMFLENSEDYFEVFTTRVDTVFWMTFVVMAPEHPLVDKITTDEYKWAVEKYKEQAKFKTQLERTELQKEKTGQFTGAYAINPFNGDKIPVYIWDYVLANYWTGVVMAVPAHDERDYDFARIHNIPIDFVIWNQFWKKPNTEQLWDETIYEEKTNTTVKKWWIISKQSWYGFVYDEKTKTVLMMDAWAENWGYKIPWWTINPGETVLDWVTREIKEETWYTDFSFEAELYCAQIYYPLPGFYRENNAKFFLFKLNSDAQQEKHLDVNEKDYPIVKVSLEDLKKYIESMPDVEEWLNSKAVLSSLLTTLERYLSGENIAYTEKWIVFNSWDFSWLTSDEAIKKMQIWLSEKGLWWVKRNYKIQDWVFSRQRYWWEPFPVVLCPDCGVVPMNESDLPLLLPDVENYEPTGTEEWPLANIDEWINVKCPHCWKPAKRESNTMPGWAWSSWYWLRYMDAHNDKQFVAPEKEQYWKNVDVYVWWAEHVTRHMIYARFWQKFLYDLWVVTQTEPFHRYEKVWLIMAEDGRKMSKRRWNVVNPDDVIAEFGADAFRTYEMFMWPFDQYISWNTNGLRWTKKFLDKVVALWDKVSPDAILPADVEILFNQTIKKTTEDIDAFRFNTSIAQFMILVNSFTECEAIPTEVFEKFVILLAPFAPHLAEEFWSLLGHEFSIFKNAQWPKYDESKLSSDLVKMAVQFNGKVRWTIEVSKESSQDDVMNAVKEDKKLSGYLVGEPKKVIYLPWKILNIVL